MGVGYSDYMWINFIQLAMLLIIDLFVFFVIKKYFSSLTNSIVSSSSSSYSFNVRDPKTHTVFQASALARVGPPVIFLQAQWSCAISSFIPIAFMSLLTQLLHVFLGAPLSTTPITFILVHFFTQLFSSFRSGGKRNCTVHSTVYCTLYSTVLYCTVQYSTVLYSTVLYCTVQYCTVLYSTVQYCTVQYSTVLYCTVYSVHCTLYSVQCTLYTAQCTVYTVHTVYCVHCTQYSVYWTYTLYVQCVCQIAILSLTANTGTFQTVLRHE